jgi:hypothetical protein
VKNIFANSIVRSLVLIFGVLLLIVSVALAYFTRPSKGLSVLHYNVYFGVDLLGAWWQVFLLPGVSLLFVLANLVLAERLYTVKRERFAAYLLLLGSVLLFLAVLFGCLSLVFINY